jgi:hypothetical protein
MNGKGRVSKLAVGLIVILLAAVAAGCAPRAGRVERTQTAEQPLPQTGQADGESAAPAEPEMQDEAGSAPALDAGMAEESAGEAMSEAPAATAPAAERAESAPVEEEGFAAGEADVAGAESAAPPASDANPIVPPDQQFAGPLQAGEIDDNEDFGAYLQYRMDFHNFLDYTVSDVDISERHTIQVSTRGGQPVLGAEVLVYDGQSLVTALRTTATGRAYFFPRAYPAHAGAQSYDVTVQKGQASQSFDMTRGSTDALWNVTLDTSPARSPVQLDVLFLVDATGSMEDEINQLKDNILSISAQIEALPTNPDVRFGLVYYRDRGDEYVTRVSDFTPNVQDFQRDLSAVRADGGNDTPESLNEALHRAISDTNWRVDDTVSIIFLVADAPPHLDYSQDYDYAEEMMYAAELGIKVFPIGSRLDGEDYYQQQAEYIFRQIAQFTGGNFIFLTYEDTPQSSGEPGTEYNVPEERYTVEDLDALVVRLVQEELAALSGGQQ